MAPPVHHYEASLERDLARLQSKLREMAARGDRSLRDGVQALVTNNRQLAYSIILRDTFIDALDREIDRLCLEFIIRQQPVGLHLRFAAAAIKVNVALERVGDYARGIAKQVLKLSRLGDPVAPESFRVIADRATLMLGRAVEAFTGEDTETARRIITEEPEVDALRSKISEELFESRKAGQLPLESYDPLLNIARRYERVSNQAKSISQETIFMVTGEYAKHDSGAVLRVLFVDDANAGGSQLAESIGQSLGDPRFLFSSAGVSPKALDPGLREFLVMKGLDPGNANPRSVAQVPNLEHYQVFIALTEGARSAFPPAKSKTVNLEWLLPDPAAGERLGTAMAYEETWNFLQGQIRDLVDALLGEQARSHG
jgi:phosphate transport system protein